MLRVWGLRDVQGRSSVAAGYYSSVDLVSGRLRVGRRHSYVNLGNFWCEITYNVKGFYGFTGLKWLWRGFKGLGFQTYWVFKVKARRAWG